MKIDLHDAIGLVGVLGLLVTVWQWSPFVGQIFLFALLVLFGICGGGFIGGGRKQ